MVLPATADPVRFADLDEDTAADRTLVSTVAAAWLLMEQPQLVDRTRLDADKQARATASRLGYTDPAVSIVDLRRQYVPDLREETGTEGGRRYMHRWVVSGHWRNQRVGSGRAEVRRTWVTPYVKGPEGGELLLTEQVNVWRR